MTRITNVDGRLKIVLEGGVVDVEKASEGRFSSDPQAVYSDWAAFAEWATGARLSADEPTPAPERVGSPVPAPPQAIGVGLNYHTHLVHSDLSVPRAPGFFAKFRSSLAGPRAVVTLPSEVTVTEVELAVVIGKRAENVSEADALDYVAGVTVAQDFTDPASVVRVPKNDGTPGGNYLDNGKSRPGFAPIGPDLVTLDEIDDLDSLALELIVDGVALQQGNTDDLVFSVAQVVSQLSEYFPLLPGDVILTGSPGRVNGHEKHVFADGQEVVARIAGIGEQRIRLVKAA